MKPASIAYAAVCLLALACLTYANVRGYVPFVASAASAARNATGSHFHK